MSLRRRAALDHLPVDLTTWSDIMFALLLFYVLTQGFMPTLPMALPRIDAHQPPAAPQSVRLEVLPSGAITWNDAALPESGWQETLIRRARLLASNTPVVVLGQREAPLGRAVEILDCLRTAGVEQVAFGGNPQRDGE